MGPSLKFFILRSETKKLYKKFLKSAGQIEDLNQRRNTRLWIRDEFKLHRDLVNEDDIKSQHTRARLALQELEGHIGLSRIK